MNDTGLTLETFVKTWNKNENAFIDNGSEIIINVTSMDANKFLLLLQSLFSGEYEFKITSPYQITATPRSGGDIVNVDNGMKPGDNIDPLAQNTGFVNSFESLEELAQRIDNDFAEIELYEDKIIAKSESVKTLETMAKIADKIDESLNIELYTDKLVITK